MFCQQVKNVLREKVLSFFHLLKLTFSVPCRVLTGPTGHCQTLVEFLLPWLVPDILQSPVLSGGPSGFAGKSGPSRNIEFLYTWDTKQKKFG